MLKSLPINSNTILDEGIVKDKLKNLGLNTNILIESIKIGYLSKSNCTNLDPRGSAGYVQWKDTVRTLREYLVPLGWTKYENGGVEGIISPCGSFKIIPSSGNAATGNPKQPSSNRNPKGGRSIKIIENSSQCSLFSGFTNKEAIKTAITYILLFYDTTKEIRAELSIPSNVNTKGHITAWSERIILPAHPLNEPETSLKEEPSDIIDIQIKKKA